MIVGVSLALGSTGITGCTNFDHDVSTSLKSAFEPSKATNFAGELGGTPIAATSISGNWLCVDPSCSKDTIATISPRLNTIDLTQTQRLTSDGPQSICRIEQTEQLSIAAQPDKLTVKGSLSHGQARLTPALENTHDCEDVLAKINEIQPEQSQFIIAHDPDNDEILINGMRYRKLSDAELKSINDSHYSASPDSASISGIWNCIDEGCDQQTVQIFSQDLKTLTSDSLIELGTDGEKCHVTEDSALAITDSSDPQKIYATRTFGELKVVNSPDNMSDCDKIAKNFNKDRTQDSEQLTIERDGNQEIILLGKRYARKG